MNKRNEQIAADGMKPINILKNTRKNCGRSAPMFQHMLDYTEPICLAIDSALASTLTFDTSGIELYVTENNPKTLNSLIRRLKFYYKNKPDVDPYKMAYGLMPSCAASSPDAKQQYINSHFCYADKKP